VSKGRAPVSDSTTSDNSKVPVMPGGIAKVILSSFHAVMSIRS
jgi:hypothetical protein